MRRLLYQPTTDDAASVSQRVWDLAAMNRAGWEERLRVRDVMNSRRALKALVGDFVNDEALRMPIANLMVKADETLARKIGRRPDTKVDPPVSKDGESDLSRKRADKRARIVDAHDEITKLEMMLPQIGRWLPGYGFTAIMLRFGMSPSGDPYPLLELRDPIQTFPGEWGARQEPCDVAAAFRMSKTAVARMFPDARAALMDYRQDSSGAVLLDAGTSTRGPSWMSQSGGQVDVYEYVDERGTWMVLPDAKRVLSFVPNVLSSPAFRVVKRFAFDELVGAYDHVLGVMAMMARLALLQGVAIEDVVMAETNIFGSPPAGGGYKRGRNAVNVFQQGTSVAKTNSAVPFEAFQQIQQLERQLRLAANHSEQEDGQAGTGWSTGKGLEQLAGSAGLEVQEYLLSMRYCLQELDSLRLEADEAACDVDKMMYGIRGGAPFAESYKPSADIKGDYRTRRVYGAMAGFDDASKIVTGLQLLQARVIDTETFMEQIDGLENHERIQERVQTEQVKTMLMSALEAQASQGGQAAIEAAIGMLPAGDMRKVFEAVFTPPPDPNAAPPAGGLPGAPPGAPAAAGAAAPGPQDVTSIMSKLSSSGAQSGSARTVGQLAS